MTCVNVIELYNTIQRNLSLNCCLRDTNLVDEYMVMWGLVNWLCCELVIIV